MIFLSFLDEYGVGEVYQYLCLFVAYSIQGFTSLESDFYYSNPS